MAPSYFVQIIYLRDRKVIKIQSKCTFGQKLINFPWMDLIKIHWHISPLVLMAYLPLLYGLTEVGIITLVAHY